jgi:transmembrane sensor
MRFDAERARREIERLEAHESDSALLTRVGARLPDSAARRSRTKWVGGALAFAMVAALGAYAFRTRTIDLVPIAQIDDSEGNIVGHWVKTGEETRQVRFADGSNVALFPNTEMKVESAGPEKTEVRLRVGRTHVHIMHRESTDYRFRAGPFEVAVTGTKFDLAWEPASKHLELALLEGSVIVTGPTLGAPRKLARGEILELSLSDGEKAANEGAEEVQKGRPAEADRDEQAADSGTPSEARDSEEPRSGTPTSSPQVSWQALLGSGERKKAVRAAEALGATKVLEGGSTSSVFSLAEAARLEGSPRLARELLLSLRQRRGERGQTAFYLGKISYDQLGDKAEAERWFQTYLREAPSGTFAEQAWTRIFELAGPSEQGKKWARLYLDQNPSGPSSARARALLR